MTIYLDRTLPYGSSDYGERGGQPLNALISILLRVGFTGTRTVTCPPVGSYPTFPSLLRKSGAVYFCCAFLNVAITGRYPAPLSCGARTFLTKYLTPRSHLSYSIIILYSTVSQALFIRAADPVRIGLQNLCDIRNQEAGFHYIRKIDPGRFDHGILLILVLKRF